MGRRRFNERTGDALQRWWLRRDRQDGRVQGLGRANDRFTVKEVTLVQKAD
jgi:hypothetical protein